jgi:hypothetical protein
MESLNDKHKRNGNLKCHSAAGEESPTFIEFLTQHIYYFNFLLVLVYVLLCPIIENHKIVYFFCIHFIPFL